MNINESDIKKFSTLILTGILLVLAFIIIKPILIATLSGLILAYILTPVYKFSLKYLKSKNLSALVVSLGVIVLVVVPIWFVLPVVLQQSYNVFDYYQKFDTNGLVKTLFPTSSERFITQMDLALRNLVNSLSTSFSKKILDILINIPYYLIDLFIIAFVFFYALRDSEKMKDFFKSASPLSEHNEKILVKNFKDITDSVIYGQIIVGIVQGLFAGLGFILFGVNNSLVLTLLAVFFSIIPFIGPWLVWGPVNISMFASGNYPLALGYLIYNVLIVSVIDNIVRSYLVSRKTNISPGIIIVGMIGGFFVFNLIGLVIGPLILAYVIAILESFRDKSIYNLFTK
jgi:predicted PurR-regulated permease PerM